MTTTRQWNFCPRILPFSPIHGSAEALASFQSQKDSLVAADVKNVTHVFFHSLIMDTSKAFDGDSRMEGYNSVMTTKDEFLKILDALYNDGYVLVRIHDIAYETTE